MLRKIWNDPVWSKVIAVVIIAIASFIYALIRSQADNLTIRQVYEMIFQLKVKVIYVLGLLLFIFIFIRLTKKNGKSIYTTKQSSLREFNRLEDKKAGMLYRWDVFFDLDKPFISDLEVFCTKHEGAPMRFVQSSCPVEGCENSKHSIDIYLAKNHIESILMYEWDRI